MTTPRFGLNGSIGLLETCRSTPPVPIPASQSLAAVDGSPHARTQFVALPIHRNGQRDA
jgi:hypothetical protein